MKTYTNAKFSAPNGLRTGKFAEDVFFILMSPEMRPRVESLAVRHGLSRRELRVRILTLITHLVLAEKT